MSASEQNPPKREKVGHYNPSTGKGVPNRNVRSSEQTCTTVSGSVLGNGGSTTTCETTHSDGSKTTTVKSCTTTGAKASVGVANGGVQQTRCKTTEWDTPANSK